jgi:hypothetical protein
MPQQDKSDSSIRYTPYNPALQRIEQVEQYIVPSRGKDV